MDFHFFGHGKVMEKSMLKKRGHPESGAEGGEELRGYV